MDGKLHSAGLLFLVSSGRAKQRLRFRCWKRTWNDFGCTFWGAIGHDLNTHSFYTPYSHVFTFSKPLSNVHSCVVVCYSRHPGNKLSRGQVRNNPLRPLHSTAVFFFFCRPMSLAVPQRGGRCRISNTRRSGRSARWRGLMRDGTAPKTSGSGLMRTYSNSGDRCLPGGPGLTLPPSAS